MSIRPDEYALQLALKSAAFQQGVVLRLWRHVKTEWPYCFIGVRAGDGCEFIFRCECSNYPAVPSVELWDLKENRSLGSSDRPKGSGDVQMAFRTDWEGGHHIYHPHDRVAAQSHPGWASEHSALWWKPEKGISQLTRALHNLLNGDEYVGSAA